MLWFLHWQGISLVKSPEPGLCYVVPTGSKVEDGSHTRSLILNETEHSLEAKTYSLDTQVLPGYIKDTSFIPSELYQECSAYQWMTVSRRGNDCDVPILEIASFLCLKSGVIIKAYWFSDAVSGQRVKRRIRKLPCIEIEFCTIFGKCTIKINCGRGSKGHGNGNSNRNGK